MQKGGAPPHLRIRSARLGVFQRGGKDRGALYPRVYDAPFKHRKIWTNGLPRALSPVLSLRSDSTPVCSFGEPVPVRDTCQLRPHVARASCPPAHPQFTLHTSEWWGLQGATHLPKEFTSLLTLETSTSDADVFATFTQAPSLLLGHLAVPPNSCPPEPQNVTLFGNR